MRDVQLQGAHSPARFSACPANSARFLTTHSCLSSLACPSFVPYFLAKSLFLRLSRAVGRVFAASCRRRLLLFSFPLCHPFISHCLIWYVLRLAEWLMEKARGAGRASTVTVRTREGGG